MKKDGGVKRSFYDGNGNLSKVVRPNQYDPAADDGAGYQYTYDHQGRVLTVLSSEGQVLQTNTRNASRAVTCAQKNVGPHSGPTFLH